MASDIFDYIQIIVPILFGIGIVGTMVYERARIRDKSKQEGKGQKQDTR